MEQNITASLVGVTELDPRINDALILLAIVIIGSIGTLVTILIERIKRDLADNTQITRETKIAANGTLAAALARAEDDRQHVLALGLLVREREDRIAYLLSQHPEIAETLLQYQPRRNLRAISAEELAGDTAAPLGG